MPRAVVLLRNRILAAGAGYWQILGRISLVAVIHATALYIMLDTEFAAEWPAFLLVWGALNCFWLIVLRRPAAAGALSLGMIYILIMLSQLKHELLFMTVNFLDIMIIDYDTFGFLITVFPGLGQKVLLSALIAVPLIGLIWWLDPHRIRMRMAAMGCVGCLAGLTGLTFALPGDPYDEFYAMNYVSKFGRSGVTAVFDYFTRGLLESDQETVERLNLAVGQSCTTTAKLPHIIMIHDESSFDFTMVPGVKVPPDYRRHFESLDGRIRSFIVEGAGGPSWYTEYNVLTGLSARSYGRFADFVTRIAAGRVSRGLPHTLRRCGYKTYSLYSYQSAFLNARQFQMTAGIENFLDSKALGTDGVEPDSFFFNKAADLIARDRGNAPMFMLVYTAANHFPWSYRYRPELTPDWVDLGNDEYVDEYLRRQVMSMKDLAAFKARLRTEFPGESFLIVRFGDHQPGFARNHIDKNFDDSAQARRIADHDVRFLTTYYAVETINFRPVDMSSAIDKLDGPYLPLVVLEAAGVPLDASFAEQKRIFERCRGLFYRCNGGAEARRFNRLLIDAGLIKGL